MTRRSRSSSRAATASASPPSTRARRQRACAWARRSPMRARRCLRSCRAPAEPRRDRSALLRLARWCGRYGPGRHADGEDGLWIEVTGVAHLYGGEERLLADLCARLARFGLTVARWPRRYARRRPCARPLRAVVDRHRAAGRNGGAARGPSRRGLAARAGNRAAVEAAGPQAHRPALSSAARRACSAASAPPTPPRPCSPVSIRPWASRPSRAGRSLEPPALFVQRPFADPLVSPEGLEAETARLARRAVRKPGCAQAWARAASCLSLYRADGTVAEARAGLSFPCRTPEHLMALLQEKLRHARRRLRRRCARAFGFAGGAAPALSRRRWAPGSAARQPAIPALLVDRLANRLGAGRVMRLEPRASHIPERAQSAARRCAPRAGRAGAGRSRGRTAAAAVSARCAQSPSASSPRFPKARPPASPGAASSAALRARKGRSASRPSGGARSERSTSRTRDYYRIEDEAGAGYWVFREGLYGREEEQPAWFLHGLFG